MRNLIKVTLLTLGLSALGQGWALQSEAQSILVYDVNTNSQHGLEAALGLDPTFIVQRAASEIEIMDLLITGGWDLLVLDVPSSGMSDAVALSISDYIAAGGKAIIGFWNLDAPSPGGPLQTAFEIGSATDYTTPLDVFAWDAAHPIFNQPNPIADPILWVSDAWADDGDRLTPSGSAIPLGGFTPTESPSEAGIVLGNGGRTICNGFVFDSFDDTIRPFLQNQMLFLLGGAGPVGDVFVRGDVNQDGGYDVSDMVFLLAGIFIPGSPAPECAVSGDLNDDSLLDVSDAVFGLAALFIPGSPIVPSPSPACGVDPTPDMLTCGSFTCP